MNAIRLTITAQQFIWTNGQKSVIKMFNFIFRSTRHASFGGQQGIFGGKVGISADGYAFGGKLHYLVGSVL